jgi:hypothetical protein
MAKALLVLALSLFTGSVVAEYSSAAVIWGSRTVGPKR